MALLCVFVVTTCQGCVGERGGDAVGFRDGELHQPVGDQKDQLEHRLQGAEPGARFRKGCDGADGGAAGHSGHHPSGNGKLEDNEIRMDTITVEFKVFSINRLVINKRNQETVEDERHF